MRHTLYQSDEGFSLLELVVAVSIMLILGTVGTVSYQAYSKNAKQAAVERAAQDVFTAGLTANQDANAKTHEEIEAEYNASSGDDLTVEIQLDETDGYTVIATGWDDFVAVRSTDMSIASASDLPARVTPEYSDTTTVLVYRCDKATGLKRPMKDVDGDFTATVQKRGGSAEDIEEWSDDHLVIMERGREYVIEIDAQYRQLTHKNDGGEDCLREVRHIGNATGVEELTYLGSNVTKVPAELPSSVTSLYRAFFKSYNFNDPNIKQWDVSNVGNFMSMFKHAHSFNQDIGNWQTTSAYTMNGVFYDAQSFNQDISEWQTGTVLNMPYMFLGATSFDQDISDWETGEVRTFQSMFNGASKFNQDLSGWDTSSATRMEHMFRDTDRFESDLSGWDVSNATSHNHFVGGSAAMNGKTELLPEFTGDGRFVNPNPNSEHNGDPWPNL